MLFQICSPSLARVGSEVHSALLSKLSISEAIAGPRFDLQRGGVRGLTTAATIWVTAAIGILVGIGFGFAAIVGSIASRSVLAMFRCIENRLLTEFTLTMCYASSVEAHERSCRQKAIHDHGFSVFNFSRISAGR